MARAHSQPEPLYERQPGDYQPRGMVAPMPYKYDYEYRHHDVYPLPTLPVPPTPVSYDQRSISWSGSPRASERSAGSDEERHEAITVSGFAPALSEPTADFAAGAHSRSCPR